MLAPLLLLAATALPAQLPEGDGLIAGTVVNASDGKLPPCQTEVVLRIQVDGQMAPFRETVSDAQGRFRFERLPVGPMYRYLAGANRYGVHYPGPRVQLTAQQPRAEIELKVFDAITQPSPLVLRQWDVTLCPEPGVLRVTEALVVENPTASCYIGAPDREGGEPVTLRLAIPPEFERTTFHEEFYGRRFVLDDGKVATGIPWPPGKRELKFTYVLRNADSHRLWERPLDLPCADVRVRVRTEHPDEVACELLAEQSTQPGEVTFRSAGQPLPAGQILRIALGRMPIPWTSYARWIALGVLVATLAGAVLVALVRRRRARRAAAQPAESRQPGHVPPPHRAARRKRARHSAQRT